MRLALASASPRRAELLRAAGFEFDVFVADIDESVRPGETAEQHVIRLAEQKALKVAPRAEGRPVLAADTVVAVADAILGKPVSADAATQMLRALSGRSHRVVTGITLIPDPAQALGKDGNGVRSALAVTTVEFAPLTDDEIRAYVTSGEPMDKAGAYAIQGLASRFVTRIEGSYTNVVGLPVALVYDLCKQTGLLVS